MTSRWRRDPTMLWVNMDTFCVELSGSRRTRRPSFGGEVTVKTTDWFLLMPLKSLVTACSCHLEMGVMEPLKGEEEQKYNKTVVNNHHGGKQQSRM